MSIFKSSKHLCVMTNARLFKRSEVFFRLFFLILHVNISPVIIAVTVATDIEITLSVTASAGVTNSLRYRSVLVCHSRC